MSASPIDPPRRPPFAFVRRAALPRVALAAAAAYVVFVRVLGLNSLQAEIYGDIAIVREYLDAILRGDWPVDFMLSAGPLYHYLIMPVIAVAGPGYLGMKLASVAVSLGVLVALYALCRRLLDDASALLALLIAGASSWLLIFSRLGNSQILGPLLGTTSLWLLVRYVQEHRPVDLVLSAAVASLGLYAYPPSFILAPVMAATLAALRIAKQPVRWRDVSAYTLVFLAFALPFAWLVHRDPTNFLSGYIGGKLRPTGGLLTALGRNLWKIALSLHVHGDSVFRSNPAGLPLLDPVSGALFLAGVVFWLLPVRRRLSPVIFVPFLLQHVSSMLVLSSSAELPSASRTLGAAPLAYVLVASGLTFMRQSLAGRPRWRDVLTAALVAGVLGINADRYFRLYLRGLPYDNTPIAALISEYVNGLPPGTETHLVGCCWQDGMPEPKGIRYGLKHPSRFHEVSSDLISCQYLANIRRPAVLIWSFRELLPHERVAPCASWLPGVLYASSRGHPAFIAAPLTSPPADAPTPSEGPRPIRPAPRS